MKNGEDGDVEECRRIKNENQDDVKVCPRMKNEKYEDVCRRVCKMSMGI